MSVWIIKSIRIVTEYDYFWNYCKRINVTFKNFYSIIFNVLRQKLIKQRKIGKSDKVNLIRGLARSRSRGHIVAIFTDSSWKIVIYSTLEHYGTTTAPTSGISTEKKKKEKNIILRNYRSAKFREKAGNDPLLLFTDDSLLLSWRTACVLVLRF